VGPVPDPRSKVWVSGRVPRFQQHFCGTGAPHSGRYALRDICVINLAPVERAETGCYMQHAPTPVHFLRAWQRFGVCNATRVESASELVLTDRLVNHALKPMVNICTSRFEINSIALCSGFLALLGANSDYFLEQSQQIDLCNGEVWCTLWGTDWIHKYYLDVLRLQKPGVAQSVAYNVWIQTGRLGFDPR
jgi:hypothetical protein